MDAGIPWLTAPPGRVLAVSARISWPASYANSGRIAMAIVK
jgi:hypothetical protein